MTTHTHTWRIASHSLFTLPDYAESADHAMVWRCTHPGCIESYMGAGWLHRTTPLGMPDDWHAALKELMQDQSPEARAVQAQQRYRFARETRGVRA